MSLRAKGEAISINNLIDCFVAALPAMTNVLPASPALCYNVAIEITLVEIRGSGLGEEGAK